MVGLTTSFRRTIRLAGGWEPPALLLSCLFVFLFFGSGISSNALIVRSAFFVLLNETV